MNVHENGRQTPRGRVLMIEKIERGASVRQAAADAGVSERTAHRWLKRWRSGDRALCDRSSAPRYCPHRLAAAQVERIDQLRRQRLTGPAIAKALGLARSTVGLVLRRLGLNRLGLLEPRPPVIRYERDRPGELIHLDIKSLGRFERIGHRISGDRTGQSKSRGIGWDHLHVAVDDASWPIPKCCQASDGKMPPSSSPAHSTGSPGWGSGWSG